MRVRAHPSKQYNVIGRRGDAKSEMLESDECISVLAAINLSFLVFIMYCYLFESYYLPFSLSYLFYFIFLENPTFHPAASANLELCAFIHILFWTVCISIFVEQSAALHAILLKFWVITKAMNTNNE